MRRSWLWLPVIGLTALGSFAALAPERARLIAQQIMKPGAATLALPVAIEKANDYIELLKYTERALDSWERYLSWVDVKTGPTGNERYISYGLYELREIDPLVEAMREKARKAAAPELDRAAERYIAAYRALEPVVNRAAQYYDRQEYAADKLAEGKALHERMIPLMKPFLKERETFEPLVRVFVRDVERREVAAIEAREGRSKAWQAGAVMVAATRIMDVFPRVRPVPIDSKTFDEMLKGVGPETSGEAMDALIFGVQASAIPSIDMVKFDEALKAYEQAVETFEAFARDNPGGFDALKNPARQMLAQLHKIREPLARDGGRQSAELGGFFSLIVNAYFSMLSESSQISRTQLRFML